MKDKIKDIIFEIYLYLSSKQDQIYRNEYRPTCSRWDVPIDTLCTTTERTKNTFTYSDEGAYIYGLKIMFITLFVVVFSSDDRELHLMFSWNNGILNINPPKPIIWYKNLKYRLSYLKGLKVWFRGGCIIFITEKYYLSIDYKNFQYIKGRI